MKSTDLDAKIKATYPEKLSIVYPNALNDNRLSYLFGNCSVMPTELIEIEFLNQKTTITETVKKDGKFVKNPPVIIDDKSEMLAIKNVAHWHFFNVKL